jgi:hypothetical protein
MIAGRPRGRKRGEGAEGPSLGLLEHAARGVKARLC